MHKRVGVTHREAEKVEPYRNALRAVGIEPVLIHPNAPAPQSLDEPGAHANSRETIAGWDLSSRAAPGGKSYHPCPQGWVIDRSPCRQ